MEPVAPPVLPPDSLTPLRELIRMLGFALERDTWAWAIVFAIFFLGVVIGIVLRLSSGRWYESLLASIPVSLFALPVSARTLFRDRGEGQGNLLDSIFGVLGAHDMSKAELGMLWLGVVMICGMIAPRILRFIIAAAGAIMAALRSGLAPPAR